jgi:hypothetical protein
MKRMISTANIRVLCQAVCCSCFCCVCIGCTTLPQKPEDQGVLRKESEEQSLRNEEEKKSDPSLWPLIIDICIGVSRIL